MLIRHTFAFTLVCLIACVSTDAWRDIVFGSSANGERLPGVEITLRLDKTEVTPKETVTLEELIPLAMDAYVGTNHHDVLRIGRYDRKLGKLVNLDNSHFSNVNPYQEFDKLPASLGGSHAMLFDIKTPKYKGTAFKFRPNFLGIYLITATWLLRDKEQITSISSAPVVLVVKPQIDAKGRAVVKPEWLQDN